MSPTTKNLLKVHDALHNKNRTLIVVGNNAVKVIDNPNGDRSIQIGSSSITATKSKGARVTWVWPD
jgi:hypothetical protein